MSDELPLDLGVFDDHRHNVWPGWHSLLAEAHTRLSAIWPGYQVWGIKEKWGDLRIQLEYLDGAGEMIPTPEQMAACDAITQEIEVRSHGICEECGAPDARQYRTGWIKTLCPAHGVPGLEAPIQVTRLGHVVVRSFEPPAQGESTEPEAR